MTHHVPGYSVIAAAAVAALFTHGAPLDAQAPQAANSTSAAPTADGKPDLTGIWFNGAECDGVISSRGCPVVDEKGNIDVTRTVRDGSPINAERDAGITQRSSSNRPVYKPQYWDKVQHLDYNGNDLDPEFSCFPAGVPRMGPPTKIVRTPTELIFLYEPRNTFRVIYLDGRPHPPVEVWEGRWMGHSTGRWEGNTLVIDSVDFTDASWIGWPGYFHSEDMHVIERITRDGTTLRWQATVEDPVLLKPWVLNPVTRRLNPNPKAELAEDLPCSERDKVNIVTKERG